MEEIKTLYIFDFDGTLFKSPYKPKNFKGAWWSNIRSLTPPIVPEIPEETWWNEEILKEIYDVKKDKSGKVILLTGRLKKVFYSRILDIFKTKNLQFDFVGLTESVSSIASKLKHIEDQLVCHPEITKIVFYDDRKEHYSFFAEFCSTKKIEYVINAVEEVYTLREDEMIPKNKLYVLIGPPGVGKTTFIKNNFANEEINILSRDILVEKIAEENGKTYNDMFENTPEIKALNSIVSEQLEKNMEEYSRQSKTVVVDMTNMNKRSRMLALNKFSSLDFFKVAVDFTPDISLFEPLLKINQNRDEELKKIGKRKNISDVVLKQMFNRYEPPTEEEGFNRITKIDISDRLLSL